MRPQHSCTCCKCATASHGQHVGDPSSPLPTLLFSPFFPRWPTGSRPPRCGPASPPTCWAGWLLGTRSATWPREPRCALFLQGVLLACGSCWACTWRGHAIALLQCLNGCMLPIVAWTARRVDPRCMICRACMPQLPLRAAGAAACSPAAPPPRRVPATAVPRLPPHPTTSNWFTTSCCTCRATTTRRQAAGRCRGGGRQGDSAPGWMQAESCSPTSAMPGTSDADASRLCMPPCCAAGPAGRAGDRPGPCRRQPDVVHVRAGAPAPAAGLVSRGACCGAPWFWACLAWPPSLHTSLCSGKASFLPSSLPPLCPHSKIPSLAALMALELHGDTASKPAELAVRLVMQVGAALCLLGARRGKAGGVGPFQLGGARAGLQCPCPSAPRLPASTRTFTWLHCRRCRTARASHTLPFPCPAPARATAPRRWRARGPARWMPSGPWPRRWPSTPPKIGALPRGPRGPQSWRLSACLLCVRRAASSPQAGWRTPAQLHAFLVLARLPHACPAPPLAARRRCTACSNTKLSACRLQQAAQNITQLEARLSSSASSGGGATSSTSSELSSGAVAGIALGCAAATAALLGAVFFVYHRRAVARLRQAQLASAYDAGATSFA